MDEYESEADRYLYHPNDEELESREGRSDGLYSDDGYEHLYEELDRRASADFEGGESDYSGYPHEPYHPRPDSFGDKLGKCVFYATMAFISFAVLRFLYGLVSLSFN